MTTPRQALRPGSVVTRAGGAPGCLGGLVVCGGRPFGLSAAHILVGVGDVAPGTPVFDAARQPVGWVHAHTPLSFAEGAVHRHDLAAFRIAHDAPIDPELPGLGMPRFGALEGPAEGMRVVGVGRHGVLRRGTVGQLECSLWVDLPGGALRFEGLFGIEGDDGAPFSQPGDSGALVVNEATLEALGILVGGTGNVSVACPLDLELLTLLT